MIFLDSNVPMYLIGQSHPHKVDSQALLERATVDGTRLVTDAEVFQEILHRYTAIGRRDAIPVAFETLLALVDEVLPIDLETVTRAREIVLARAALSARDAVHIAAMERAGVTRIMSFDRGFDGYPGIERLA
jgi:uncharacterized protein